MYTVDKKSVLVTGGTGSFGSNFIESLLATNVEKLVIFSRDELKQSEMRKRLGYDSRLRFFLGDVRELDRLKLAFQGIDLVVHAAALKQVETGEYNPFEFVKTNVIGSQNVIEASMSAGVQKIIALSTDKASSPINLYGATKLTADKLFIAANNYSYKHGTEFAVVRYGNVVGSRGSVIPNFLRLIKTGSSLPITDRRMTRFSITMKQAVDFVVTSLSSMQGGELFVPKIPSMRIIDLVEVISPEHSIHEIGIRPGEKLHEEMISSDDSRRTTELPDRFIVNPVHPEWGYAQPEGKLVDDGFSYSSDKNLEWLSKDEIRDLVKSLT